MLFNLPRTAMGSSAAGATAAGTCPGRLDNDWWLKNVFNKIGNNRPKLYNGLVDRLNARGRAANNYYKLMSDSGGADGVSLTLYHVRNGNMQTLPISAEDFAGSGGEATP